MAAAQISVLLLKYLDVSVPSGSSDVAGAFVTETGVSIVRDSTLPFCVAKAKLNKGVKEPSQDLYQE